MHIKDEIKEVNMPYWNKLLRIFKKTKKPCMPFYMQEPTESGYYWYRPSWAGWEMVKVACAKGCGDKLYCFIINANYTILCESIEYMSTNGIWCTKIEQPEEE